MKRVHGDGYSGFLQSLETSPSLSIRKNPFKISSVFDNEELVPWSANGKYLNTRPSFTSDPLFHAGCYYVQEASSQFLEQMFLSAQKNLNRNLKVLDLCAAPGGKSTHLLSMMNEDDLLVSNEIVSSRNNILRENIIKWGLANVIVTQNDPSDFSRLEGFFDVIVADAPCSGEGLFRKDKAAIGEWSEENVHRCISRQHEILDQAYNALSPGGFLIYSTCTFEPGENEEQVKLMVEKYKMELTIPDESTEGIIIGDFGYHFYPHKVRGEGFFISMLQKTGERKPANEKNILKSDSKLLKYAEKYLGDSSDFIITKKEERVYAIRQTLAGIFSTINRNLYVRLAGIFLGEIKGDDFIPSEALALSLHLKKDLPSINLNREDAIRYLRGEAFSVTAPKGWLLATFEGFPLGWMKNLGSRINNYYPKEWRIRK